MHTHHFGYATVAALVLSLAACASVPPPTDQLAAARTAIEAAETAGAAQAAPVDLSHAREKLTAAQMAMASNDQERARRFANEAQVDAQLAQAKATSARAREGLSQAESALRALRDEVNRAPGSPATTPSPTTETPTTNPSTAVPVPVR